MGEERKLEGIKVIVFDFDGTLVDLKINYNKVRTALKENLELYGYVDDFSHITTSIELFSKKLGKRFRTDAYKVLDKFELKAKKREKDICQLLKKLSKHHILILVTRNGSAVLKDFLYKYPYFKKIYTRNDLDDIRDKSSIFNKILKHYGKKYILVVDDNPKFIKKAKNIGLEGIVYGKNTKKILGRLI